MKTLILYASKKGAAREIAERIAKRMDGAVLHDIKGGAAPNIDEYDCVVVGSSIYAGAIQKEAREFVTKAKDSLKRKRLGLYVSGLMETEGKTMLTNNFPTELIQSAKASEFLGGIFDPKKSGLFEKIAMKSIAKISTYTNTIDDEKIERFAEALKS